MRRAALLSGLAAGTLALAVVLAARAPGYRPEFALAFAIALSWRLALGRDGRRLLPRRVLTLLVGTLLALGVTLLFTGASEVRPAPLPLLLEILTALSTLALLGRLDTFGAFWLVLLSSTHAAGACYVGRDWLGLLLVPLYVAALAGTLVVLERAVSEERRMGRGGVRLLVDPGSPARRPLWGAVLRLVGTGFVLGLAVWLLVPAPGRWGGAPRERDAGDAGRAPRGAEERAAGAAPAGSLSITGPDETTDGVVLGTVGRIQEDNRVHFEVRLVAGDPGPTILLREDALDTWEDAPGSAAPRWRSDLAARAHRFLARGDGWVVLPAPAPLRRDALRSFACTVRLDRRRLFLEPDALAFRLERPTAVDEDGRAVGPLQPLVGAYVAKENGQWVAGERLRRGDVVSFRSMPQPRGGPEVLGSTSGADVSPAPAFTGIDGALAQALLEASRGVPGVDASDPWRRAQALERWLQGPRFTYDLSSPSLAAGRRVLDFLTRVRKGNCEWFATSLTLLLRAHGLSARYVRGYWGGAHTPDTDLWTFYGTHYHAWVELHLEGVGWVPLNPTPPERLAEGADPRTRESARRDRPEGRDPAPATGEPGDALAARLRRLVGRTLWEDVVRPAGRAFTLDGAFLGWGALALALAGLWLRRRRGASAGPPVPGAALADDDPYAEALRLLQRRGLGRRRAWTAREFLARTARLLPEPGAAALVRLTEHHERRRYAGAPGVGGTAREDLAALGRALRHAARGGAAAAP